MRPGEKLRVALRDQPLLHPTREESAVGELEVTS